MRFDKVCVCANSILIYCVDFERYQPYAAKKFKLFNEPYYWLG
jgi:hypothetical protein